MRWWLRTVWTSMHPSLFVCLTCLPWRESTVQRSTHIGATLVERGSPCLPSLAGRGTRATQLNRVATAEPVTLNIGIGRAAFAGGVDETVLVPCWARTRLVI